MTPIDILDEMMGRVDYKHEIRLLQEAKSRIQAIGDGWIPVSERFPYSGKYIPWVWIDGKIIIGSLEYIDDGFPVVRLEGDRGRYGVHNFIFWYDLPNLPPNN